MIIFIWQTVFKVFKRNFNKRKREANSGYTRYRIFIYLLLLIMEHCKLSMIHWYYWKSKYGTYCRVTKYRGGTLYWLLNIKVQMHGHLHVVSTQRLTYVSYYWQHFYLATLLYRLSVLLFRGKGVIYPLSIPIMWSCDLLTDITFAFTALGCFDSTHFVLQMVIIVIKITEKIYEAAVNSIPRHFPRPLNFSVLAERWIKWI